MLSVCQGIPWRSCQKISHPCSVLHALARERHWTKTGSNESEHFSWLGLLQYPLKYFVSKIFRAPPTALQPNTRYERIIEAFGGKGYFVETPDELRMALKSAFEETSKVKKPVLINAMISPYADRKPQVQYI